MTTFEYYGFDEPGEPGDRATWAEVAALTEKLAAWLKPEEAITYRPGLGLDLDVSPDRWIQAAEWAGALDLCCAKLGLSRGWDVFWIRDNGPGWLSLTLKGSIPEARVYGSSPTMNLTVNGTASRPTSRVWVHGEPPHPVEAFDECPF